MKMILVMVIGLPAMFVGGFYGITYYLFLQTDLDPNHIYSDVNNEQEM